VPSHGSLTKAGKVRSQTPKIPAKPRIPISPRIRFRRKYVKRIVYPAQAAQASS
jgi:small subunit ribosomal protein S30e